MSSPLVGSARLELTADLSNLGGEIQSGFSDAMSGAQDTVDSQLSSLSDQFNAAGTSAGEAFGTGASTSLGSGTTADAVAATGTEAADAASTSFGAAGDTAGSAFADAAAVGIGTGSVDAVTGAGDAVGTAGSDSFGTAGGDAGDAFATSAADAIDGGSGSIDSAVSAAADGLSSDAFGGAGTDAGDAFSSGLGDSVAGGDLLSPISQAMDQGRPLVTAAAQSVAVESGERAVKDFGAKGKEAGSKFGEGVSEGFSAVKGTILGGLGILGVGELVKGSIEAADASEAASIKTKNVFGDSADVISTFAEGAVSHLRETSDTAELMADQFGQFFISLGQHQDNAAHFAANLTGITANVAAFNNVSQGTVQSAFDSALKGRTAALAALGIQITPVVLAHEALAHNLTTANQKMKDGQPVLSKQQTAMAAYYAIVDQTSRQQSALANTSDTARAKQAELSAQTKELETKVGQGLMPVLIGLEGLLINDVVPALVTVGHWIVQNKSWIEPLVVVVGGLWAAFKIGETTYKVFDTIGGKIKDIRSGFSTAVDFVKGQYAKWTGAEAEKTAATETAQAEQDAAIKGTATAQQGLNTAQGESPGLMEAEGAAAAALSGEMDALAASTQAAADAQAELDVAQRGGGGGGLPGVGGRVGPAANEGERAAQAAEQDLGKVGGAAAEAETALAGVGTEAAAMGEAGAAGAGAVGSGMLGILGPVGLVTAAVGYFGFKLGDALDKSSPMTTFQGMFKDSAAVVDTLTKAIAADGNQIGATTAQALGLKLQQDGLADSATKAGVSMTELLSGVTGTDTGFANLVQTLQSTHAMNSQQLIQLQALHNQLGTAKTDADQLKVKQDGLNAAVNAFKSPPPVELQAYDHNVATEVSKARTELENLNGQRATVYIAAITDTGGALSARGTTATVHFNAAGTPAMKEGWNVVGDAGPELLHKSGSHVEVVSNAEMMRGYASTASSGAGIASTGAGFSEADLERIMAALMSRPAIFRVDRRDLATATNEGNMRLGRQ